MKGPYWRLVSLENDLELGASSVVLTMSDGVGSVPIPNKVKIIGVKPASSSTMRIGLEAPSAASTATGNAASSDLSSGVPVEPAVWTWFNIGSDVSGRVLYVKGGASDVITVVVM